MNSRDLEELAHEYVRAELTLLWSHDQTSNRHVLLFGVVELCPTEQERSAPIECEARGLRHPMERGPFGKGKTSLYATRVFTDDVQVAVAFFRRFGTSAHLDVGGTSLHFENLGPIVHETAGDVPFLVGERGHENYASVLPRRDVDHRVCSRFAAGRQYFESLDEGEARDLVRFAQRVIGVDLENFREHVGALHLAMPNPYVRAWSERLVNDGRGVLLEFFERDGRSIAGCTLQLTDFRDGGPGFDVSVSVNSSRFVAEVPADPHVLETRLRSPYGELIGYSKFPFLREIRQIVGVTGAPRRVHTQNSRGTPEVRTISPTSWDLLQPQEHPFDPVTELSRMRETRKLERSLKADARERDFYFFEGGPDAQDRARGVIRALVGSAHRRCLMCDPYLGADDVADYATFVLSSGLRVELLTSSMFLRNRSTRFATEGERLDRRLQELQTADPGLSFDCRVLLGRDKPPVHDRFLWLDDSLYVLGSSLNEFGARATTLFRAPAPQPVFEAIDRWWTDSNLSRSLADWLGDRDALDGTVET